MKPWCNSDSGRNLYTSTVQVVGISNNQDVPNKKNGAAKVQDPSNI